jgi:hypothetical protein
VAVPASEEARQPTVRDRRRRRRDAAGSILLDYVFIGSHKYSDRKAA